MYQYDELPCGCLQAANPGDRRPMPVVVRYCYEHALADSRDTPRVQRTSIADRLAIFGYLVLMMGLVVVVVFLLLQKNKYL